MSRIVFATLGSLGSLQPYFAVGLALKERGHSVVLASNEAHRSRIEVAGLCFHPVCPDRINAPRSKELRNASSRSLQYLMQHAEETYEDLLHACSTADLFISHTSVVCAPLVAETLDVPWISVALTPGTMFSASDPPVFPSLPWMSKLPRIGNFPHSLIFRAIKRATRRRMEPLNALRARRGLPATTKHPFFEATFSPSGTLGWFSHLFGKPQPDWPPKTQVTGFVFLKDRRNDGEADPSLARFLKQGDPPVVFTLGSNVVNDAGDFYDQSLEAVQRIGCRAVFLTGDDSANHPKGDMPASVFVSRYAPYSDLFPFAAAVVHQGGIGTTAQTMAAGLPMLIVPFIHDQPDNAHRAARLGIARVEARTRYTADRAAKHIQALLSDSAYTDRARWVRAELQKEDGLQTTCKLLEQILNG